MKQQIIVFSIIVIIFLISLISYGQNIPSSSRSQKAIKRVTPILIRELSKKNFKWGSPIFIRIFKESKELELWLKDGIQYRLFKIYKICTYGPEGLGPKIMQGDGKAPEGFYFVTPIQLNPISDFYLSFDIGYPNKYDKLHGRTGNNIMVHGKCTSIGCFAMTDSIMEEIYTLADAAFRNGQKSFQIHIFPFRMNKENMKKHKNSIWFNFWKNLKEGYDLFESSHIPPNVEVIEKKYIFYGDIDSLKINRHTIP